MYVLRLSICLYKSTTFVSIKNECLIVTNFTLVNLNLSSVTCSGVSHIWTEKRKEFDETANYAELQTIPYNSL